MDDKLLNLHFLSGEILLLKKVSMPLSARMMASISPMGKRKSDTFDVLMQLM